MCGPGSPRGCARTRAWPAGRTRRREGSAVDSDGRTSADANGPDADGVEDAAVTGPGIHGGRRDRQRCAPARRTKHAATFQNFGNLGLRLAHARGDPPLRHPVLAGSSTRRRYRARRAPPASSAPATTARATARPCSIALRPGRRRPRRPARLPRSPARCARRWRRPRRWRRRPGPGTCWRATGVLGTDGTCG